MHAVGTVTARVQRQRPVSVTRAGAVATAPYVSEMFLGCSARFFRCVLCDVSLACYREHVCSGDRGMTGYPSNNEGSLNCRIGRNLVGYHPLRSRSLQVTHLSIVVRRSYIVIVLVF